jgi:uncharacterized protein
MNKFAIKLIEHYQQSSSNTNPTCRYSPTCSEYAKQAFQQKNFVVASGLSVWRILRCNPLSKGGYDPVPGTHND